MFGAGVLAVSGRPDPWLVPCPQSSLACDGMLVPVDHDSGSNATMWIAYGVHRAAGPPKGTLAIAVGGPGDSGIGAALSHIDAFDPRLVDGYDLLFWDQRGVGASEGKDCPRAGREYVTTPTTAADTAAFVQACLTEAGVAPDDLARYSTHQAAEDLESDPGPPGPRALRPVRRELWHRARPAVRGEPPRSPDGTDPRRRRRPDAIREPVLGGRRPRLRAGAG